MPDFNWQTVATLVALTWAVVYVTRAVRRVWISRQTASGCGTCGSCPTKDGAKTLVTIDRLNGSSSS
jgi:hypothetical protein